MTPIMMPMMYWLWGGAPWWFVAGAVYWLVSLVFIVWSLVDIAGAKKDAGYKVIWAAIAVFLGLLGVLLYYLLEKRK